MPRFKHYRARGIKFVFKYDDVDPDLLHIYARHLTTPTVAVTTFFSGLTVWNDKLQRFETITKSHCLY